MNALGGIPLKFFDTLLFEEQSYDDLVIKPLHPRTLRSRQKSNLVDGISKKIVKMKWKRHQERHFYHQTGNCLRIVSRLKTCDENFMFPLKIHALRVKRNNV